MPPMKWTSLLLVIAACGAGDDTSDGARAKCAFGGQLNDCPDAEKTPQGACWRLVDCGAIPIDVEDPNNENALDWGVCVDAIDDLTADRERLVVECIVASTCDELRTSSFCFELGQ
jgi:hypothetical protein